MNRREFIRGSAFAAAGVLTGCATGRTRAVPAGDGHFIRAALIHLGSNMWCDVWTDNKPRPPESERWDFKDRVDHLRTEDAVWRECTEAMRANGFNMAVIDVGEALEYPSHPELKVKGSWSVGRMREELARLRKMAPKSVAKIKNTLATQFHVADVSGTVAALAEKGLYKIDGNHIEWAAEPTEA